MKTKQKPTIIVNQSYHWTEMETIQKSIEEYKWKKISKSHCTNILLVKLMRSVVSSQVEQETKAHTLFLFIPSFRSPITLYMNNPQTESIKVSQLVSLGYVIKYELNCFPCSVFLSLLFVYYAFDNLSLWHFEFY